MYWSIGSCQRDHAIWERDFAHGRQEAERTGVAEGNQGKVEHSSGTSFLQPRPKTPIGLSKF